MKFILPVFFVFLLSPFSFAEEPAGSISGKILYEKDALPKPELLLTNEDQDFCGRYVLSERLIINSDTKGVKNVVVTLTGGNLPGEKTLRRPKNGTQFKSDKCAFSPHILIF
ncbi:MAG: hypothetical protein HY036_01950 [Nitrospirae bacterium]|nr:hypothetical protein [Nitrospirota bacterium]MBI3351320.1 hypothetical protein [Nitrospirota bacterium]